MKGPERRYDPWTGDGFDRSGRRFVPDGVRLLVLAESAYDNTGSGEPLRPDYPAIIVQNRVMDGHGGPMFDGITRLLAGDAPVGSAAARAAWHEIAFTEYVQEPLSNWGISPSSRQFREAVEPFFEIVTALEITHVLAISRRLWDNMAYDWAGREAECLQMEAFSLPKSGKARLLGLYRYETPGHAFLAAGVYHPSARGRPFDAEALKPSFDRFLELSPDADSS